MAHLHDENYRDEDLKQGGHRRKWSKRRSSEELKGILTIFTGMPFEVPFQRLAVRGQTQTGRQRPTNSYSYRTPRSPWTPSPPQKVEQAATVKSFGWLGHSPVPLTLPRLY